MTNKPITPEEMRAYVDATWEKCQAEAWQEPVAWMYHGIRHDNTPHERPSLIWEPEYMDAMSAEKGVKAIPLYTAPRQWRGLTGDEVNEFAAGCHLGNSVQTAIRKAEAKLKEKNT